MERGAEQSPQQTTTPAGGQLPLIYKSRVAGYNGRPPKPSLFGSTPNRLALGRNKWSRSIIDSAAAF